MQFFMKLHALSVVGVLVGMSTIALLAQDEMPVTPADQPARVIRFETPPAKVEPTQGETPAVRKPESTEILHKEEVKRLLGKHLFALQWISWDDFGTAEIKDENGVWSLKAEQKGQNKDNRPDYAKLEGWITKVEENKFTFTGRIETQVTHMNGGKPCVRTGEFTFEATGKRKYYRLVQMENPCEGQNTVDYLDIFFKGPKG